MTTHRLSLVSVVQERRVGLLLAGAHHILAAAVSAARHVLAAAVVRVLVEHVVARGLLEVVEVRGDAAHELVVAVRVARRVLQLGEHLLHARRALGDVRRAEVVQVRPVQGCYIQWW